MTAVAFSWVVKGRKGCRRIVDEFRRAIKYGLIGFAILALFAIAPLVY